MNTNIFKTAFVLLTLSIAPQTFSKEASLQILSPRDGAKLMSKNDNLIKFEATPGPKGDHVHIYVDDKDPIVLRQLKGQYAFKNLEVGTRNICIKLVDKNHTPVGVEKCIKVNVE